MQKKEEAENIAYTFKETNAVGGKVLYNAIALCSVEVMTYIKDVWDRVFEWSEFLFVCDESIKKKGQYACRL
jgi:hypothetical protein